MVQKDVSKQTVVVLVFLAILVSLLGTLTVMQEVTKVNSGAKVVAPIGNSESSGQVRLNVQRPTDSVNSVGTVRLVVEKPVDS